MTGERHRRSALSLVYDRANGLTLAGLVCGVLAISFIARGAYAAAMTALLWALFCDWFDGPLARRSLGRTDEDRAFGVQLDSLVDIVSGGVAPAMLLVCMGEFNTLFVAGALLLVIAGAIRLAHFNVLGPESGAYNGLPIDTNIVVVTASRFASCLGTSRFPGCSSLRSLERFGSHTSTFLAPRVARTTVCPSIRTSSW